MIKLGQKGRDKVTNFEGIIIAKSIWLFGCNQYALTPSVGSDGKVAEALWIDEGRVEVIGNGVLPKEVKSKKDGGPQRDAPKRVF